MPRTVRLSQLDLDPPPPRAFSVFSASPSGGAWWGVGFAVCFGMLLLALGTLAWLLWRQRLDRPSESSVAAQEEEEEEVEKPVEVEQEQRETPIVDISDNAAHLSDRVVHNMSIHNEGESRPFVSSLEQQYRCINKGEVRSKLKISEADQLRREGWQCEDVLYRGPVDTIEIAKLEEGPSRPRRPTEDLRILPGPTMSGWESHGKRSPFVAPS